MTIDWIKTPLIFSSHISKRLNCDVYLKLENLQYSQSFKYRGLSLFTRRALEKNKQLSHLVVASGGNAGLATACVARIIGLKCTVFLPEGVSVKMMDFLLDEGATVNVRGKYYLQALAAAKEFVQNDKTAILVPAYDDRNIWEGHASIVSEIKEELPVAPDAIFCSVGGGGLIGGIMTGCTAVGWDDVLVAALETRGSACFYQSIAVNSWNQEKALPDGVSTVIDEHENIKIAHLSEITSRATSLGASSPAAGVVKLGLERRSNLACITVPDELSMKAALLFAEDHKFMTELACATTLTPAYNRELFDHVMGANGRNDLTLKRRPTVVFVVCGGVKISLEDLVEYRDILARDVSKKQAIRCNAEEIEIAVN